MKKLIILISAITSFSVMSEITIDISISQQRLFLFDGSLLLRSYPISSSAYGEGQIENSLKTPLGKHEIQSKIGTNVRKYDFFVSRRHIPQKAKVIEAPLDTEDDYITSRILWLTGLEPGVNMGGNVDSNKRFIYIHGTHEEGLIGIKASHGCIRMFNQDVLELYEIVSPKTPVNLYL